MTAVPKGGWIREPPRQTGSSTGSPLRRREPPCLGEGNHLVHAAAAEALEVEGDVVVAGGAEVLEDAAAGFGFGQAGDVLGRDLDPGQVVVVVDPALGGERGQATLFCSSEGEMGISPITF